MKTTNDIVVHHNYLNESIFNFNELELNLFIVILYKMRNFYKTKEFLEDLEGNVNKEIDGVIFDAKEIKSMMQMKDRSFKAFEKIITGLQDRTISLKTQNGYIRIKAFPTLIFNEVEKNIEIDINKRILPLFMELTEQFTQYSLKEFLSLNSKHSKRMYQLLKQYEGIGERTISVDDLKKFLEIEKNKSYNRLYNKKKRVLETTKNDINLLTTLNINYEKEKQGKEVVAVTFKMKKSKVEEEKTTQKETRNELINRYLKHYKVKYIKDLDEIGKKFLDTALASNGYKITAKRITKGEK